MAILKKTSNNSEFPIPADRSAFKVKGVFCWQCASTLWSETFFKDALTMLQTKLKLRPSFIKWAGVCLLLVLLACSEQVTDLVGPSNSGFTIGIKAFFGTAGLPADGTSKATIRVEVFDENGRGVSTTVTLTTTRGTLGTESLTVTNGVGITTLTSVTSPGTASIVATIENASATTIVPIVNISSSVS